MVIDGAVEEAYGIQAPPDQFTLCCFRAWKNVLKVMKRLFWDLSLIFLSISVPGWFFGISAHTCFLMFSTYLAPLKIKKKTLTADPNRHTQLSTDICTFGDGFVTVLSILCGKVFGPAAPSKATSCRMGGGVGSAAGRSSGWRSSRVRRRSAPPATGSPKRPSSPAHDAALDSLTHTTTHLRTHAPTCTVTLRLQNLSGWFNASIMAHDTSVLADHKSKQLPHLKPT